ncbi:MAG: DNA polymerase IV [Betaproteobacteria bacterium]|nr:DNA polymerase IV [Betaproteobacteria bacterium]
MPDRPPRLIAHLDMDAFYASVELLRYPQLRGRPVVVGGGRRNEDGAGAPAAGEPVFATLREYVGRGVATTATYEARALGVHSGMGLMKAARLAPDALRLPADFDAYRRYSRLFKDAVRAIAPAIEDRGIDEIYIDLTEVLPTGHALVATDVGNGTATQADAAPGRAELLARAIKDAVRAATGLASSIGIAPNKLLAKIASDLDKPDGITIVTAADIPSRIWPLPARRINGIGPKAEARLATLGLHTIGDLAGVDAAVLIEQFGPHTGRWLHESAHGRDDRPVVTASEPKSISRETTLEHDLDPRRDRAQLSRIFTALCEQVSADLQRKGYAGRTIGLKLRFDNFRTVTRDHTLPSPAQDALAIRRAAGACLKRIALDRRIRLLGVRVGALSPAGELAPSAVTPDAGRTLPLFD